MNTMENRPPVFFARGMVFSQIPRLSGIFDFKPSQRAWFDDFISVNMADKFNEKEINSEIQTIFMYVQRRLTYACQVVR